MSSPAPTQPTPDSKSTQSIESAAQPEQPRNPLHGLTLEAMLTALVDYFGWAELAERIPIRCFALDPSVKSSLKFLRKTPWAREKVEGLYLFMLREIRRRESGGLKS
ncbi:MAG: DUF2132 domain-containing protein [Betaproteobacteria bacterium]|nr:MAG: DUF2132 domain-containing protein [Betaproteobacteria bacterium]